MSLSLNVNLRRAGTVLIRVLRTRPHNVDFHRNFGVESSLTGKFEHKEIYLRKSFSYLINSRGLS